jgi:hypothetical protein
MNISLLWSGWIAGTSFGAVARLVGDVNGDHQDEIIQLQDNGGRLGITVYGWVSGSMSVISSVTISDAGPPACNGL